MTLPQLSDSTLSKLVTALGQNVFTALVIILLLYFVVQPSLALVQTEMTGVRVEIAALSEQLQALRTDVVALDKRLDHMSEATPPILAPQRAAKR